MVKPEQHQLSKYNDYPSLLENIQYEPKVNSFINIKFQVNPRRSVSSYNAFASDPRNTQQLIHTSHGANRSRWNFSNLRKSINSADFTQRSPRL